MEEILIIDDSEQICAMLANYVLPELGYHSIIANTGRQGLARMRQHLPDLVLLDLQLPDISGLDLLRLIAQEGYDVPVILMTAHGSEGIAVEAFRLGARNYLIKPFSDTEARAVIDQALRERRLERERDRLTRSLQQRVQELTVLYSIGKSVSALMSQEELLERIVEAGVYITRAEEGFLLLRDERSNELYLRAAKNVGEQRAQHLRLPINDGLAGQVVRTGKAVRIDKAPTGTSLKVKTGFFVRSIIQVPLTVGQNVIGVLAVDNQQIDRPFSENDQYLLSALADYAAIAIENANLYQQVKRSEERYKDLFTNAYDLIFTLDQRLHITSINKVGQELTGYEIDELVDQPLQSLCRAESWQQAQPLLMDLLAGDTISLFELELVRRDRERVYLEVSARPITDGAVHLGIHCIARDVTERRSLELQLIQSEKLSALGRLAAGVAHDVKKPVATINLYAQSLLRETSLSELARSDIQVIRSQSEWASNIAQSLLDFARQRKPERTTVNLNDLLKSIVGLCTFQLKSDNVKVVYQLDPDLPTTIVDPQQIGQVFMNLINNADQAMTATSSSRTLTLQTSLARVQRELMDGERTSVNDDNNTASSNEIEVLRVCVSDTGSGIPADVLTKIFDPFFTTKSEGQGTGLGLSISFGFVREHDGRIWAESTPGVGTTMIVDLPLVSELDLAIPSLFPETDQSSAETTKAYRILVVDDDETTRTLIARLMTSLGYKAEIVASGEEALKALERESADLILTDVQMPGMSGFELYQAVQQRAPELADRMVFVTGDALNSATQSRITQLGNAYIAKPFENNHLQALVRGLLLPEQEVSS